MARRLVYSLLQHGLRFFFLFGSLARMFPHQRALDCVLEAANIPVFFLFSVFHAGQRPPDAKQAKESWVLP